MKSNRVLIIGLLICFILLSGLSFPAKITSLQTNPDPTPTVTPIAGDDNLPLKSGETQGLMIGAGVIVFIILGGVLIQRFIK